MSAVVPGERTASVVNVPFRLLLLLLLLLVLPPLAGSGEEA